MPALQCMDEFSKRHLNRVNQLKPKRKTHLFSDCFSITEIYQQTSLWRNADHTLKAFEVFYSIEYLKRDQRGNQQHLGSLLANLRETNKAMVVTKKNWMFFRSPEKQIIKFPRVIHPFHYSLGSALKKTRSQLFCEDVRFSRILEHHTYFEVSIIQAKRNK